MKRNEKKRKKERRKKKKKERNKNNFPMILSNRDLTFLRQSVKGIVNGHKAVDEGSENVERCLLDYYLLRVPLWGDLDVPDPVLQSESYAGTLVLRQNPSVWTSSKFGP